MVVHHREIERKFEKIQLSDQATTLSWELDGWQVAEPVEEHLDATYFDTADERLGFYSVALRRRLGGADQGWHIKFDVAGHRHEVGFDLLDDIEVMPAEVVAFVQLAVGDRTLEPRVSLRTTRLRSVLTDERGVEFAEICDDRVVAFDSLTGIARRWQEWEIELLPAGEQREEAVQQLFSEVGSYLERYGILPSTSAAKIARALGYDAAFEARRASAGAEQPVIEGLGQQPGGGVSAEQALVRCMNTLVQADLLLQLGVADATHQGRVAARSLRSILKHMVAPFVRDQDAGSQVRGLMAGLQAYARQLEPQRNGELIYPLVRQNWPEEPGVQQHLAAFGAFAASSNARDLEAAQSYLKSTRRLELQAGLEGLLADVSGLVVLPETSEQYLAKVARRVRKNLLKQARRALATWPDQGTEFSVSSTWDEGLHDIRKAAKAVRYCLNACGQAGLPLTKEQAKLLARARALQSELGVLTDELTVADWLFSVRPQAPEIGLDAFALGFVAGRTDSQVRTQRLEVYSRLPRAVKKLEALQLP